MQPAKPVSPVAPGQSSQQVTVPATRGAKKGVKRGPSRPPAIVFRGKMLSTFKTANRLLEKLQSLRDSRMVRGDEASARQYAAFLTNLNLKIQECAPVATVSKTEALESWLQ